MFEFGAVLFLVSVFPETLLYTSVYALVRSLAVALLSSWLGSRIDRMNRLTTIRQSIGMSHLQYCILICIRIHICRVLSLEELISLLLS